MPHCEFSGNAASRVAGALSASFSSVQFSNHAALFLALANTTMNVVRIEGHSTAYDSTTIVVGGTLLGSRISVVENQVYGLETPTVLDISDVAVVKLEHSNIKSNSVFRGSILNIGAGCTASLLNLTLQDNSHIGHIEDFAALLAQSGSRLNVSDLTLWNNTGGITLQSSSNWHHQGFLHAISSTGNETLLWVCNNATRALVFADAPLKRETGNELVGVIRVEDAYAAMQMREWFSVRDFPNLQLRNGVVTGVAFLTSSNLKFSSLLQLVVVLMDPFGDRVEQGLRVATLGLAETRPLGCARLSSAFIARTNVGVAVYSNFSLVPSESEAGECEAVLKVG